MAVYVDDMRAKFRGMIMCHMIADTEGELHDMAHRLGLRRNWYQGDHYDVSLGKRDDAIRYGAMEITWKTAGLMMAVKRRTGRMPPPETAETAFHEMRRKMRGRS